MIALLAPERSVRPGTGARVGDREGAATIAEEELAFASDVGSDRHRGMAIRALGVAVGGAAGISHLREAVSTLQRSASRLEHARALVELGGALRRANHRSDARPPLREGLAISEGLGGHALAKRASDELSATGSRVPRRAASGIDALTPSESRVVGMARRGLGNREIAESLFVTRKTVEKHLSSAYAKLGIRSRDQLREIPGSDGRPRTPRMSGDD